MPTEKLAPDAILAQTDLTGAVTDIDDDPASPDANWLTATNNNVNTDCRVGFPSPTGAPRVGAGLQTFRAAVREFDTGQSGTPQARLELWENGSLIRAGSDVDVTTQGQVITLTWNANEISTADGSLVECNFVGTKTGGSPSTRNTVELGAIEWEADYTAGRDALYARNWDVCLLDATRLDSVHDEVSGSHPAADGAEVFYITDLSSAGNDFAITEASGRWVYDTDTGRIEGPGTQNKMYIETSVERTITQGTYFFAFNHTTGDPGGQPRLLRTSNGSFRVLLAVNSNTVINCNTSNETLTNFTVSSMAAGLHVAVVTLQDNTTTSTLRFYLDSGTEIGNRTTAAQDNFQYDTIGNNSATNFAKFDGIYLFGMTTDLYSAAQVGDLIDEVTTVVNDGPVFIGPRLGLSLNGG